MISVTAKAKEELTKILSSQKAEILRIIYGGSG
jgi:Fe-S cluster assembly iron-binding protein IscA